MFANQKFHRPARMAGCAGALVTLLLLAACQNFPLPLRESSEYLPSERNYAGICSGWGWQGRNSDVIGGQPQYRCQHPYSLPEVAAAVEVVEIETVPEPEPAVRPDISIGHALFAFDSAALRPQAQQELRAAATKLREHPDTTVLIRGYTDSTGTAAYNEALSIRRAQSAQRFLIGQGVDDDRLTIRGYGESDPVASNATAAGRQQNRRVEIDVP